MDEAGSATERERQRLARARESLLRARALSAATACGGTVAQFEQMWPNVFDEILRRHDG